MASDSLTVVGIRPSPQSVTPNGLHLRWSFPPPAGFPAKGFEVYRRESTEKSPFDCTKFAGIPAGKSIPQPWQTPAWTGYLDANAGLAGTGDQALTVTAPGTLQVHFHEPVVRVRLHLAGLRRSTRVRAFAGKRLASQSDLVRPRPGSQEVLIEAPLITSVEIPLNFQTLIDICYVTLAAFCRADWGRAVARLPIVPSVDEALKRLPAELKNRYAGSTQKARAKYGDQIKPMIEWLHLLQTPDSPAFENRGDRPDQLRLRLSNDADAPINTLHPQSILLLASLDPNLAQMLGLYWVDRFGLRNGPKPSLAYDYKVVGTWKDQQRCGVFLNLGKKEAPLPAVSQPITSEQLDGIHWRGETPIGRVRLQWPRTRPATPVEMIVRPMFYDVERRNLTLDKSTPLTKKSPLIDNASSSEMQFVDPQAELGSYSVLSTDTLTLFDYRYQIRGIDIFGQVGPELTSTQTRMRDLESPPPPIRLSARITQPGEPWRGLLTQQMLAEPDQRTAAIVQLFGPGTEWIAQAFDCPAAVDLRFEYGASQYQQAPDAARFFVHWRSDSLVHSVPLEWLSFNSDPAANTTALTVAANSDLERFAGGWITNVEPEAETLDIDVSSRRRLPIRRIQAPDRIDVDGTWQPDPGETYWLVADPYHRQNWQWTGRRIDVQKPLEASVSISSSFQVSGTVAAPRDNVDSGSLLPPDPNRPPQASVAPELTEILLDVELLDTNLFGGGSVRVDGGPPRPVLYSTAGTFAADNQQDELRPRIAIEHDAALVAGQQLGITLQAAASSEEQPALFHVTLNEAYDTDDLSSGGLPGGFARRGAGGELAWFEKISGDRTLRRARIVSSAERSGGKTSFLVHTAYADLISRLANQRCQYYAAYLLRMLIDVGNEPTGDLQLPVSLAAGSRQAYFSLLTSDRGQSVSLDAATHTVNHGPLSAPAQVTAVRPPQLPIPEAPLPCDSAFDDSNVTEGFVTPPDLDGRATVCIKWRLPSSEEGLRFEVARGLDSTIITSAKRAWLRGDLADAPPLQHDSLTRSGPISLVPSDPQAAGRGLIIRMSTDTNDLTRQQLAGGRIRRGDSYARVLQSIIDRNNNHIDFRVELTAGAFEVAANAQDAEFAGAPLVDGQPVWSTLLADVAALRGLAGQPLRTGSPLTLIDEAFGLVTGVPLRFEAGNDYKYTDEVPGVGRNRFFFCVRSVDSAENRSAWSPISVAFHQVDTSPPDPPQMVAGGGDRAVTIRWPSAPPGVNTFHLYRADSPEALQALTGQTPFLSIDLASDSVTWDSESGQYRLVDSFAPQTSTRRDVFYRMTAVRTQRTGRDSDVDIESLPSEVVASTVLDLTPPNPPDWRSAQWIDAATNSAVAIDSEQVAIDLRWETSLSGAKCMLQRRAGDDSTWFNVSLLEPTVDGSSPVQQFQYRDHAVDKGLAYDYRILIFNAAGRTNQDFVTQTLTPPDFP